MKKTLAFLVSFIMLLSIFSTFTTVSAEEENAYNSAKDGDVLYTVNFNGDPGVFEPKAASGIPDAYVKDGGASMQLIAVENKTETQWGGEIQTLPLNENTKYTIYYSITRTAGDGSGLYIDGVYGAYGYANRTKILEGTGGLSDREYTYYLDNGLNITIPEVGTLTQDFAMTVDGAGYFGHYIKDDSGEFVLIQESYTYDKVKFNSDKLGLYFYAFYADHVSTFSNCYIVKGLAFASDDGIPDDVPEGCVNTRLELGEKTRSLGLLSLSKSLDKVFYPAEGQEETWEGVRYAITDVEDPYLSIDWLAYIYKARLENVDSQAYPYVALKLKIEGYVDDFELFFCAGEETKISADYSTTTIYPCKSTGEVEYVLFDLVEMCEGEYNRFRIDAMGSEPDTVVYLYEIALFATEQEAHAYMGLAEEETEATTEPETEAPGEQTTLQETEPPTEAPTTAPDKQEEKGGCGSVVGTGFVTLCFVAVSAICTKKKKD